MNRRFDWSNIPTETIKQNIRLLSKEYAHLKDILERYKKKNEISSLLLSDLEGLLWENKIILDDQIRVLRKKQKKNINCNNNSNECIFHGKNNNDDPRSVIVKIDVNDAKMAIDHLEEIIESYKNRKYISSGLLKMFEYFLSEYKGMINIKSTKKNNVIKIQ